MAGLVLLHSDFPDAMQGSAASKVPCGGEQQETFPRAGLSQHFVPGPCGERGSEPASSLIPVSIHFVVLRFWAQLQFHSDRSFSASSFRFPALSEFGHCHLLNVGFFHAANFQQQQQVFGHGPCSLQLLQPCPHVPSLAGLL